ncbi:helix-turn-helix transcriptional regulator [Streptomyces olivoreticuli]
MHPYVIVRDGALEESPDSAGAGGRDLVVWRIREEHRKDLAHVPCLASKWGTVLISPVNAVPDGAPEVLDNPALSYVSSTEGLVAGPSREGVSDREREIMNGLSRGFTNHEIAQELFISEKTVKNHINRLFAKLGARHRAEAMAIWLGLARAGHREEAAGPRRPRSERGGRRAELMQAAAERCRLAVPAVDSTLPA